MMLWGVILLIVNLALIGAIFYIILFRKPVRAQGAPVAVQEKLVRELNHGISEVKSVAQKLESRSMDLSKYENGLRERQAVLEELIVKASVSANSPQREAAAEDVYSRALKMLKSGVPAGEIARSLGLLSGEAELLSSLHGS